MKEQELRDNQELVIPQMERSITCKTNILNCCKELVDMQLGDKPSYLMATPSEQHSFYDSLIANKLPNHTYTVSE